jgi:hypothetical protein
MWDTTRYSEEAEQLQVISPASYNSAQALARVKADQFERYVVKLKVGAIASTGTVDFKVEQANAASGGTVKAFKSITQLTQAGSDSNKQRIIEFRPSELDINNGFSWFLVTVTPAVAATLLDVEVTGVGKKNSPVAIPATLAVTV